MQSIKVLKRKDASSVIVAVVLALIVNQAVSTFSVRPADWFSGAVTPGGGWRAGFWEPLILLIIELIVLEIVIRVYTMLMASGSKK